MDDILSVLWSSVSAAALLCANIGEESEMRWIERGLRAGSTAALSRSSFSSYWQQ